MIVYNRSGGKEKAPEEGFGGFLIQKVRSGSFEVHSRHPAGAVGRQFEFDLLAFVQAAHACSFNCADVYEYICAAAFGLDETKTFLRVKPFNGTLSHCGLL